MKLSIIIPVKNEELLIKKIVDQLQNKLKNLSYEIIFVDDFSTDNTFKITKEISTEKLYRICKINYENFADDLTKKKEGINFSDLELIFKDLKNLFEKKGFVINWSDLKNENIDHAINTLSMASPFSIEE